LFLNRKILPPTLDVSTIWVILVGNYPSIQEHYLLTKYLDTDLGLAEVWICRKIRDYRAAGIPETFIRNNDSKTLFDVSETLNSKINSGIQRIVRSTAHELQAEVIFTKWLAEFGILTTISSTEVEHLLSWQPSKNLSERNAIKTFGVPRNVFEKVRVNLRLFLSKKGVVGKRILNFLIFLRRIQLRSWVELKHLLRIFIGTKSVEILFDPNSPMLVLELQSLDLRIVERVHVQLNSKMFKYSFLVHDTLPLRNPQYFHPGTVGNFAFFAANYALADNLFIMAKHEMGHLAKYLATRSNEAPQILKISPPLFSERNLMNSPVNENERFRSKKILIVGSLEPRKNHVRMLRAIRHASLSIENIMIEVVYPNQWLNYEIFEEISLTRDQGIQVNLHHSISDEDLFCLYQTSSLLLFCSLAEGLGLPLLEARSFSLPTITSDVDFMAECVKFGGVKVVNPLDVFAIANAIESVLGDYELWKTLSEGTRKPIGIEWPEFAKQFILNQGM
jgi:glycosyltransferase involved in cell wall biosynthesis